MDAALMSRVGRAKVVHLLDLLSKRNVVGVGLGYKVSEGVNTGILSLVVSVTRKESPPGLSADDLVPRVLSGIKTDVVETGMLRAFGSQPGAPAGAPTQPGVSLGHHRVTAGTFGCLVHRSEDVFILSNNHVLANTNRGRTGDAILHPSPADGGTMDDRIAVLSEYVPIDFGSAPPECPIARSAASWLNYIAGALGSRHKLQALKQTDGINKVDAALASPLFPGSVRNEILHIGAPSGVGMPTLGTPVQKTGRTTGHTRGTITQIDATVRIDYNGDSALFTGQLIASPMSSPGDSGSVVVDSGRRVVGLLFAGSSGATVLNPIDWVLSALNVELTL